MDMFYSLKASFLLNRASIFLEKTLYEMK